MPSWSKPHVEPQLMKKLASLGGALNWEKMCMGHYRINPYIWEVYWENKMCMYYWQARIWIVYLYQAFQIIVKNASITYTKYKSWIKYASVTYKIHFHLQMRKSLDNFLIHDI